MNGRTAFLIGGVNSGSGKTTLSLALMRAFSRRGLRVCPFKCGPDYIDPFFHRQAAGCASVNLDAWLAGEAGVKESFRQRASGDVAVVEGVMGLFDGIRPDSMAGSSAEIASLLGLPVILAVNARGISGSIAPLVKGFAQWHPDVHIAGVIATFIGSERHGALLRDALAYAGLPPLLGTLRRDERWTLPERHLGLSWNTLPAGWLDALADAAEQEIDLDALLKLRSAVEPSRETAYPPPRARLAVARDEAFCFYYEENFRILRQAGVETVAFSPLHDARLPEDVQGIYLGGGYPELYASALAANTSMLESIRSFAARGKWVYGECGGFLYLLDSLTDFTGKRHVMLGLLHGESKMNDRLHSLGYRSLRCAADSVFGKGMRLRGHEFHYSSAVPDPSLPPLFEAENANGALAPSASGAVCGSVCGSYAHVHFGSNPGAAEHWAEVLRK